MTKKAKSVIGDLGGVEKIKTNTSVLMKIGTLLDKNTLNFK